MTMEGDKSGGYPTTGVSGAEIPRAEAEPKPEKVHHNAWPAKEPNESDDEYFSRLEGEDKGHVLTLQDISDIENSKQPGGRSRCKAEKEEVFQAGGVTTLTLRNIPTVYTEEGVLMELYQVVPKHSIDFFYMPWDSQANSHCGYAIVNFTMPFATMQCIQSLSGKQFSIIKSSNVCTVEPTELQGIAANLEHYKSEVFQDSTHGPKVYKNGKPLDVTEIKEVYAMGGVHDSRVPSFSEVSKHSVSTKGGTSAGNCEDNDDGYDNYSESETSSRTGSEMSGSHASSEGSSSCDSLNTVEPTVLSNFAARFG